MLILRKMIKIGIKSSFNYMIKIILLFILLLSYLYGDSHSKEFVVIDNLTSTTKQKIKKYLSTQKGSIQIVGHSGREGTTTYNFALSLHKAQQVKIFLVEELDYSDENIKVIGYGESRLKCTEENQHLWKRPCRELNPRVVISILP